MAYPLTLGTIAFLLAVIWGPPLIALLKKYRIGQIIRIEGPSSHQSKMGTPTMGGFMIIAPVFVLTIATNLAQILSTTSFGQTLLDALGVRRQAFSGFSILVPLFALVAFGIFGAIDDFLSVRGTPENRGMLARHQVPIQLGIAGIIVGVLYFGPPSLHTVGIPGVKNLIDLGPLWLPIALFIIFSTANAVNVTDGLDGLAGTCAAVSFAAYAVIAFLQEQGWLATFCFIMVGAILAFLWFNAHPAQMFMGGVGSMALGGTLGTVALMTTQWLLLPIIGIIFVSEALSVTLQVAYFKHTKRKYGTGRRIFKMSPLHNHFVLSGWSETQITQRFWLVSILGAMLGIALALL
jgi:phospho-N-acetylmuramoyl-pentapeptide-transferase